jgi:branched-chain amino acid transport system substrate-binding protein
MLLPPLLAALALAGGWWWWTWRRPIAVAVGMDLPLVQGAATDPSDRYTAIQYRDEHPGSRIALLTMFNHPDPARAPGTIAALKRRSVRFFVTTQTSSQAVPSLGQFSGGDALAINVSAVSNKLSGRDDFLLRVVPDLVQEQQAIARELNRRPGGRLLVLQDTGNPAWTEPAWAVFSAAIQRAGRWQLVRRQLDVASFDPRRDQPLVEGPFDGLYVLAGSFLPTIGNLSQLFHQLHPRAPIVLTPWARSPQITQNAGKANARITVVSPYPARRHSDVIDRHFQRFERRFGYTPYAMTIGTRQALELLDQAFASGATTPAQVKRYLLEKPVHQTSLGPVRFDRHGDVQADFEAFAATADQRR